MARTAKGSGRFPVRQGAGALFPGQAVDAGILAGHLAGYALRGELHGGTRPQLLDGSNVGGPHVEAVKGHGKVQRIVGIVDYREVQVLVGVQHHAVLGGLRLAVCDRDYRRIIP